MSPLEKRAEDALNKIDLSLVDLASGNPLSPGLNHALSALSTALVQMHENRKTALNVAATRLGAHFPPDRVVTDARVFADYLNGETG